MKNKKSKQLKSAFSLLEVGLVIIVIGLVVAAITQGTRLIQKSKLMSARSMTSSSPVPAIDGLTAWLETTSEKSFIVTEAKDGQLLSFWKNIAPQAARNTDGSSSNNQRPTYVRNGLNGLPMIDFIPDNDNLSTVIANYDCMSFGAGTFPEGNPNYTIFYVAMSRSNSYGSDSFRRIMSLSSMSHYFHSNGIYTYEWSGVYDLFGGTYTNGTYVIVSTTYAGGLSPSVWINGQSRNQQGVTVDAVKTSVGDGSGQIPICHYQRHLNGMVGEVITYNRSLKTEERQAVEDYLSKKWGIKLSR